MVPLQIQFPLSDAYEAGDVAEIKLDGVVIAEGLDLAPGKTVSPSHLRTGHLQTGMASPGGRAGFLQGGHLRDPLHRPRLPLSFATNELYYGLHTIDVETSDRLGNKQPGAPVSSALFINTGPRPPTLIRFDSQTGSGPIAFSFTPSPELT